MSHRSRSAFACLLAAAYLTAQLAGLAHAVLAQHVRCAEHGELVDVGRSHAPLSASVRPQTIAVVAPAAPSAAELGDDHCGFAHHARSTGNTLARPAPAVTLAASWCAAPHVLAASAPPVVALLSLAPKTSPPV